MPLANLGRVQDSSFATGSAISVCDLTINLQRLISVNPWAEVWEGQTTLDRKVIVKLQTCSASAASSGLLTREAHTVAKLRPPRFAPLLAYDWSDGRLALVSERLLGESLEQRLRRGPLKPEDVLALAESALRTLLELHDLDYIHGDLKPEHFHITGNTVALCDFGFSHRLEGSGDEGTSGATPGFAAPEVLGLLRHPVGPYSDLYSLGLVLASALDETFDPTRKPIEQRLQPLPKLSSTGPAQKFVARLCQPDPQARPQTAQEALDELYSTSLLKTNGSGSRAPGRSRQRLTSPKLAGRDQEVVELSEAIASSRTILVSAPSGRGKTFLLEAVAAEAESRGTRVFWARAVAPQGEARWPMWVELSQQMGPWIKEHPARLEIATSSLEPRERQRLARAFPAWGFWSGAEVVETVPEEALQIGLQRMLVALSAQHPLLLIFDDIQWADPFTLHFLERKIDGLPRVAAFRDNEIELLAAVRQTHHVITLPCLDEPSSANLLASMAGHLDPEVLAPLLERGRGEPFLLGSLLRGAVENGELIRKQERWSWGTSSSIQTDRRQAWMISDRIEAISDSTRLLLEVGAVMGRAFLLPVATKLAGLSEEAVREAYDRHLVWIDGEKAWFTHDIVREALLKRISELERHKIHSRLAHELASLNPPPHAEIALHYAQAGQPEQGLSHAVLGAREAASRFDYALARALWQTAQLGLGTDAALNLEVRTGLALSALMVGELRESVSHYRTALTMSDVPMVRAELTVGLTQALAKTLRCQEVSSVAAEALRDLGVKVPRTSPETAVRSLYELLRTVRRSEGKTNPPISRQDSVAGRLLVALADGEARRGNPALGTWPAIRGLSRTGFVRNSTRSLSACSHRVSCRWKVTSSCGKATGPRLPRSSRREWRASPSSPDPTGWDARPGLPPPFGLWRRCFPRRPQA